MQCACPTKEESVTTALALFCMELQQHRQDGFLCVLVYYTHCSHSQPYFELERRGRMVLREITNLQVNYRHQRRYTFCYLHRLAHNIFTHLSLYMPLYWKANSAAAYRDHGESFNHELHNLTVWVLFTKTSARSRSIWLLFPLHSCFPEIMQQHTRCSLLLPMCTDSHSLRAHCTWLTRGTYQLKLAFLPTAEPHPWLSFRMCWHKLLHPRSRPVAPFHPCLGGWWLHEAGYYSGSRETEEEVF